MKRKKLSLQNAVFALLSELLVALVGFAFPQAIIHGYGSATNGLITSLQQMMQYFTLIEAGLSGAAVFALYKPLAQQDTQQIQRILCTARKLFTKIGLVFTALVVATSLVYPLFIADTGYSHLTVSLLFCMIGINGATQLFFIGKYKVLLNASQNNRYVVALNAFSTCLFSLGIIVAAWIRLPILVAVLIGCGAYLIRALCYYLVTKKLFPDYRYTGSGPDYAFQNQREVFIQQILSLLVMNSSVLILSFTKTDMAQISVFTVYNMVLAAVLMLTNAVHNGVSASFGDLIARGDKARLRNAYGQYEFLYQIFFTVVFSCVIALFLPFIRIYSKDFTDADYIRPSLCVLFGILGAVWSVRIQQSVLIVAAGKFKEIQRNSIVEAVLAIALSLAGLYLGGLEGLLVGRVLAALYRAIDFTRFSHRYVLELTPWMTVKGILGSSLIIAAVAWLSHTVTALIPLDNYLQWVLYAIGVAACAGILSLPVHALLYRTQAAQFLKKLKRK